MAAKNTPTAREPKKLQFVVPRSAFPDLIVTGRAFAPQEDLYHFILTLAWPAYVALVSMMFFAVNAVFAVFYWISPGCVGGVATYEEALFFSVQTLGTIGYGAMSPATRYGHAVVSIESLVGILMTAVITGLTFAKFARPTARVLFSRRAVLCPRDGVPHLMFRMANWRHNQMAEAQLRVSLLLTEVTREGDRMRRFHELPLVRDRTAVFVLTWTAMHRIDEASPFYGDDAIDKLREREAELYLSLSGIDETTGATVHARYRYAMDDVAVGFRFADVITVGEDGVRHLDYLPFHDVVANEKPAT